MLDRPIVPSSPAVSRRSLLRLAAAAAGLLTPAAATGAGSAAAAEDAAPLEAAHRPRLRVPASTSNGSRVPVTVEAPSPLERDHGVSVLEVVNPRDPVPGKGVFHFMPASGRAYVAFQARFDEGPSTVLASSQCPRHGRFGVTAPLVIAPGAGGCAGGPPSPAVPADEIRAPEIRIPKLVAEGVLRADETIQVQVKTKHPNRTGLAFRDGRFVPDSEPFHLTSLEATFGDEPVCRFALTAALSDNPLITFLLRVHREGTIRVTLTNTRGQRFEARHPIRFA